MRPKPKNREIYLCDGLGRFDASNLSFFNRKDARLEIVLRLGLVGGDLPVGLDGLAGLAVEASAVGEWAKRVVLDAAEHML